MSAGSTDAVIRSASASLAAAVRAASSASITICTVPNGRARFWIALSSRTDDCDDGNRLVRSDCSGNRAASMPPTTATTTDTSSTTIA